MLLSREQKNQLTIRLLKKVLFLIVLFINTALISIAITTLSHAALPRAIYGQCYFSSQSIQENFIKIFNSSQYAISNSRFISSAVYNSGNDTITATAKNTLTGATTSTNTYVTEVCNDANTNYFDLVPIQDLFFQGCFVLSFFIGVSFGTRFFTL